MTDDDGIRTFGGGMHESDANYRECPICGGPARRLTGDGVYTTGEHIWDEHQDVIEGIAEARYRFRKAAKMLNMLGADGDASVRAALLQGHDALGGDRVEIEPILDQDDG
ncbi:hypothetical protein [Halococcus saccharolyticus]|nr:hypothetical protein [Halococcus saccharolyticus]